MSAIVCRKRSFFEDIDSAATSPTSASPPVYKKFRCSSATSPVRFSYSPPISPVSIDQLKALFPDMETQLIEKALEKYGDDLDSAIKSLHELRLVYKGNLGSTSEEDANFQNGWVDFFVGEMMSATSIDDARTRAARALDSLEKSISARAGVEAAQNFLKENMMLKEQIEALLRENAILKRAVAIQHERQKEHDERNQEVQQLKLLVTQYQEQLRTLEVNNYALKMHLRQAEQSNSIPGHFHPDVF